MGKLDKVGQMAGACYFWGLSDCPLKKHVFKSNMDVGPFGCGFPCQIKEASP